MARNAASRVVASVEDATTQNLVVPGGGIEDLLEQYSGMGTSQRAEDNLIPMIGVLQALSPAADKRNQAHIQGAEPGAFRLKNSPVEIIPGDGDGLNFIPAHFKVQYVEWRPREVGGGFVAQYDKMPVEARRVDGEDKSVKFILPNGNEVQETRYHTGLVLLPDRAPLPFVITFKGSGHTSSREWQVLMDGIRTRSGAVAPSFARVYKLTTFQKTTPKGTWFQVKVKEGRPTTVEEINSAAILGKQVASGEKKADVPAADEPVRDLENEEM